MKSDLGRKRARLGEHVPDWKGYDAINYRETDLQVCRVLAGEAEKVRDRLAALIASASDLGEQHEDFSSALRQTARFKDDIQPDSADRQQARSLPSEHHEGLLDLDLAFVESVAALHSLIDRMEVAAGPKDRTAALTLYLEGLREADELLRKRERWFGDR